MSSRSTRITDRILTALLDKNFYIKTEVSGNDNYFVHNTTDLGISLTIDNNQIRMVEFSDIRSPHTFLSFLLPTNPESLAYSNLLAHVTNISKNFTYLIHSRIFVTRYFKIGRDTIGVADNTNEFVFSFERGIVFPS